MHHYYRFSVSHNEKYCCLPGATIVGTFISNAGLSSHAIGISSVFSFTWIRELDDRALQLEGFFYFCGLIKMLFSRRYVAYFFTYLFFCIEIFSLQNKCDFVTHFSLSNI